MAGIWGMGKQESVKGFLYIKLKGGDLLIDQGINGRILLQQDARFEPGCIGVIKMLGFVKQSDYLFFFSDLRLDAKT